MDLLPSKGPLPAFTDNCRDQGRQNTDSIAKVRAATPTIAFPAATEPMVIVQNPGTVNSITEWKTFYSSYGSLIYVDKDVVDNLFASCYGKMNTNGNVDLYINFDSVLNLKVGWNVILTETNVSNNESMAVVSINARATQDFAQFLMSAR